MFDLFRRGGPSQKQIDRAVKRLTEPHGEEGPRYEAAERLLEWGTPEALFGLVKRFSISSLVITQDVEEKKMVVEMLVNKGQEAVGPLLRFMKSYHRVDWPVRALARIVPEQVLIDHLIEIIETVAESEFTASEHRVSLLRAIQGHVTEEMSSTLRIFLNDSDDDVRIVAIDALASLGESVREPLLEVFLEAEERPRIRRRIAEILTDQEWPVKGFRPKIEESLPDGFALNAKGLIKRR
jgi:HEAT repeat protein